MRENITVNDIGDKFNALEDEIRDLKRDKAQAEGLCAAIMKKVGRIEDFSMKDIFNSDYNKVRFHLLDYNSSRSIVLYMENEEEEK